LKSAATDGRFMTFAFRDERRKIEECGHGWPLLDLCVQGRAREKLNSVVMDGRFLIFAFVDERKS
jgi:hypothetical protein